MIFTWGKENFLKEAFLPPTPPSFQELSKGNIVLFYIVRSNNVIQNLKNLFTNFQNYTIIIMPNELNNRTDRYIFLYGETIPFCAHH